MSIEQINNELNELINDHTISTEEKNTYVSIYKAELERQKADLSIYSQKQAIEDLRIKIINAIINLFPNLDEKRKDVANHLLWGLGLECPLDKVFAEMDDVIDTVQFDNGQLNGNLYVFLDENIHNELEKARMMEKQFNNSVSMKYSNLKNILSSIIDPNVFIFLDNLGEKYKDEEEFNSMFKKESDKINNMNIGSREKGILRNILLDTIRYGKSCGTMYHQLSDLSEYIDIEMSKKNTGKSM